MYFGTGGADAFPAILGNILTDNALVSEEGEKRLVTVVVKTRSARPSLAVRFTGFRLREPTEFERRTRPVYPAFSFAICASTNCTIEVRSGGQFTRSIFDRRHRIRTITGTGGKRSSLRIHLAPFEEFTSIGHQQLCRMVSWLDDFALLHPGTATELVPDLWEAPVAHYYPDGLASWLFQNDHHRWPLQADCLRFSGKVNGMAVEGALRMLHAGVPHVKSFVNGWPSHGGAHHEGLGDALKELFPDPQRGCRTTKFITNPNSGAHVDLPHSFLGILKFSADEPRYEDPTKDVLIGDHFRTFVRKAVSATLREQWEALYPQRL